MRTMSWPARTQPFLRHSRRKPEGVSPKANPKGSLGARDAPCTYSAKLKIFNLPKHIQLLRFGRSRTEGSLATLTEPLRIPLVQRSAGRWVGCPRIRGAMSTRITKTRSAKRPSIGACARARLGLCAPLFTYGLVRPGGRPAFGSIPGGGDEETRTPDPLLAKEMLCQLSYVPRRQPEWWATLDSNQ